MLKTAYKMQSFLKIVLYWGLPVQSVSKWAGQSGDG